MDGWLGERLAPPGFKGRCGLEALSFGRSDAGGRGRGGIVEGFRTLCRRCIDGIAGMCIGWSAGDDLRIVTAWAEDTFAIQL
jgi:hypothetical protein